MAPSVAKLMAAIPETDEERRLGALLPDGLAGQSQRGVPVGRWRRMRLLGTLQAKLTAAYLFYWVRGWFAGAESQQRKLAETHWKSALRTLDSMSYLRGAVMKLGQTLANFPDIAPAQFVETLNQLHFNAPPMHWSLLEEMVRAELGDQFERRFARFEHRAFAAASLGQVHAAALDSGEELAVKIQYPGIGRSIRDDFAALFLLLLPGRLSREWEYTKAQFHDLHQRLARETDYRLEAEALAKARLLFREEDGIVVPRVYPELSSERVLTMERLPGVHLDEFLAGHPPQELRNAFARKLLRSWYRMLYAGRTLYCDPHPGNYLFMEDGRLGVVDFGNMLALDEELWEVMRRMDRPLTTGRRDERLEVLREWAGMSAEEFVGERAELHEAFADWSWRARYCGGEFDFGDEAHFRHGVDLFTRMVSKRYTRAKPCTPTIARQTFGIASLLYRLRARIDVREIAEQEVAASGWDRSDYAA